MVRKALIISADLAERIKEFRHDYRLVSEQEAFRLLLEYGLETQGDKYVNAAANQSLQDDPATAERAGTASR